MQRLFLFGESNCEVSTQQPDILEQPPANRSEKRRLSIPVHGIQITAFCNEQLDNIRAIVLRSNVQRCRVLLRQSDIGIASVFEVDRRAGTLE
jgi:hypothetical protein